MKKVTLFILITITALCASAFNITFRVDMSTVTGFTTPELNGSFNSWCGNCIPMTDSNGDGIWEVTIDLAAGMYEYKFSADNWGMQESLMPGSACTVTNFGFTNRALSISADAILPIVCWNYCTVCSEAPQIYNVTFQVDMSNVTDFTTPEINGTFNNWCGNCNPMSDPDGDGVWTITLQLQAGNYDYLFSADNWGQQETFTEGAPCTNTLNGGFVLRSLNVSSDMILTPNCWSQCSTCGEEASNYNVTFMVDMSDQTGFTTPEVNGTFNGWCGNCSAMSDVDGDNIWEITINLAAGSYEYTFSADSWNMQETLTQGEFCTTTNLGFTNRILNVESDMILPTVCWGSCSNCSTNNELFNVTFQLDMSNVASFTTPEVNGTFNNWCGSCSPMSNADGDQIWTTTLQLPAGVYEYNFSTDNLSQQESIPEGSSCTVTNNGFTLREIVITEDAILPAVCWNSCSACSIVDQIHQVTFQLDMSNVTGFSTPEVNGTFNGWCGNCTPLTDTDGDNIWITTIPLTDGEYQYKFSYDNWSGQESLYSNYACTYTEFGFVNRNIVVTSDTILPPVCWNYCTPCSETPQAHNVTFQLDTHGLNGYLIPEVNGDFNNWCGSCSGMSNPDNDAIWSVTIPIFEGAHTYLFSYDNYTGIENLSGLPCSDGSSFNLRTITISNDTILPPVCWGSCELCPAGCLDPQACNYNFQAGYDDGSCTYSGCTDINACNYNGNAACADNSCLYPGCNDANACNFNFWAGCDDGSCVFPGCNDLAACNYNDFAACNDGSCTYPGCTNSAACNYQPAAGCDNGSCLFTATTCNDNNVNTMLDQLNANCNCQGTPFNYGAIATTTTNLCPGVAPQAINVTAPLNLQSYAVQWYYRDGANACPSGNSTAGWNILTGENGLSYTPSEFVGARTYACFISPSGIYGIPAAWANGCRTISYYSFDAQTIIGNPNIAPFSSITYAVNPIAGHTYNWSVTNGAITSGQGTNVITILWGQNGPYQVTMTESNGICSDVSTLLVVNSNCSISVTAIAEGGNSFCPGSSTTLQAVSDATGISYQWYFNGSEITGATDASVEITSGGNYQVLITQAACSAVSQTLFITTLPAVVVPQLSINATTPGCSGGTVVISAEGGSFDSYLWNNGETTSSIEVSESGDYSVDLADANGCLATAGPVSVNLALQEPLPICIVSVDETTNNNIIVWEPLQSDVTSAYTIYKETNIADQYASIGTISYGSDGMFTDPNSNASVQASRYKIALIDTCGIESFLTQQHKTIHLTSNVGLNNTVNLIWSHYEGFFFGSYNIYRGDAANNLTLLTTIASNLNSYTDLNPLAGPTFYVIEVDGISCDPTREVVFSRSNVIALSTENIAESIASKMAVFPNPTSGMISINLFENISGKSIILSSITGERLFESNVNNTSFQLNMEEYAAGIYLLQLRDRNGFVESVRIVKQ
jgi:1,4-alpha-glucan branching enzyme